MKKILITGNSGYIGSHLSKMLTAENGYEIHGLDINNPQHPVDNFYNIDITKPFSSDEEYDAVIHLAALVNVGESEKIPTQYYVTNLNGTVNVLRKIKTKNFIFASTGAAELCESAYGISKRAAEDVVKEYCVENSVPYTIFRFYNVIGTSGFNPTNPDGLMYNLLKSKDTREFTIFGNDYPTGKDGTCIRDYVHVDEICYALKLAIENPANNIECLGHGVGHSVAEMFEIFERVNQAYLYPTGEEDAVMLKYGPRRPGDAAVSVLEDVSSYMVNMYSIEELLKVDTFASK